MKHLRWNPLLGEWIIVSPRRKNRFNKKNPFASDSPEMVGKEVPTILENKYPNFQFIGPSPIDYDTRVDDSNKCVWNELCRFNLLDFLNQNNSNSTYYNH